MSIEFDIACLRAPCDPGDVIGVTQLIDRAKMAADQIEGLIKQRDEALSALYHAKERAARGHHGDLIACDITIAIANIETMS